MKLSGGAAALQILLPSLTTRTPDESTCSTALRRMDLFTLYLCLFVWSVLSPGYDFNLKKEMKNTHTHTHHGILQDRHRTSIEEVILFSDHHSSFRINSARF